MCVYAVFSDWYTVLPAIGCITHVETIDNLSTFALSGNAIAPTTTSVQLSVQMLACLLRTPAALFARCIFNSTVRMYTL